MSGFSLPRQIVAPAAAGALAATAMAALGEHPALGGVLAGVAAIGLSEALRRREAPCAPAAPPAPGPADPLPQEAGREVLERLPIGLLLLDAHGHAIFENDALRELFGRSVGALHYAAALRAPALVEAVRGALEDGLASELDATPARGGERVLQAMIRPMRASEGGYRAQEPAVLVLLEDRTRIVRAEELRRDFIANASHELKTPLASISGFIETLQGHARSDPDAAERFLGIMSDQADRMKRLVEDLLSLNRIETNEHVRPRELVDLGRLASEAAAILAPAARAAGAEISVAPHVASMAVRGDPSELIQVISNLIDNALKYGGGAVRLEAAAPDPQYPGQIGLTVRDNGPGIAREHLPRLTERFYRIDVARSRERGGTGLGLAIVKHILMRHRGELAIASTPGQGSAFTIWLPPAQDEARRDAA